MRKLDIQTARRAATARRTPGGDRHVTVCTTDRVSMKQKIAGNLKRVQDSIAEACGRAGRDPRDVQLIAVTKTVGIEAITALLELGHVDLGESRVQELTQREAGVGDLLRRQGEGEAGEADAPLAAPRWHMIGHLQRNKVKALLGFVEMIHSMDSLRLAEEINTAAAKLGLGHKVKTLLQVNTSQEKQKHGLAVGAVVALAEQIATLPNLEVCGLMTMAPLTEDRERARFCFARLRELFDELRDLRILGPGFRHLSMGMSQDYPVAIEEGATLVRVGTALFR